MVIRRDIKRKIYQHICPNCGHEQNTTLFHKQINKKIRCFKCDMVKEVKFNNYA